MLFFSQAPFWPPVFLSTFLPLLRSLCLSLNCCACLCVLWAKPITIIRYIPLPSVSTTCFPTCLPTCLQVVSLSSLRYRASVQVSSIWDGEESFSPLSFLSLLVPLVFPSAFFTSLLIHCCCSLRVLLDPGLLILLVSHLCPCLFPLFSPSCILSSLPIAILLSGCFGKNGFPGLCFPSFVQVCVPWDEPIIRYIPLPSISTTCFPTCLPTCLQVVSLSSLHYRASVQVSSIWNFSHLPFLSLLVPLVFPSAFFTSLLITVVLSGCFWDTKLFAKPPPKAAPQSCCSSKQLFLKVVPESLPKMLPKQFPEAASQSCSPKRLCKAVAPKRLLPKDILQIGSRKLLCSPKRLPKAILQSGPQKLCPKVATESCSPKLPLFCHIAQYWRLFGWIIILFSIDDFWGLQKSNKFFRKGTTPPVCFPILSHSLILVAFLGGYIL